mmetsp:Transcript_16364/g.25190  ORF Transcript_16364/g.25190 Transcript_16364/m.25190 type:complete len:83 (-) Transcript_16364:82-330(-)
MLMVTHMSRTMKIKVKVWYSRNWTSCCIDHLWMDTKKDSTNGKNIVIINENKMYMGHFFFLPFTSGPGAKRNVYANLGCLPN